MALWGLRKTIAFLVCASLCLLLPIGVWSLCAYLCAIGRGVFVRLSATVVWRQVAPH